MNNVDILIQFAAEITRLNGETERYTADLEKLQTYMQTLRDEKEVCGDSDTEYLDKEITNTAFGITCLMRVIAQNQVAVTAMEREMRRISRA